MKRFFPAVLLALPLALVACQSVGPTLTQSAEGITSTDASPNRLVQTDGSGQWSVNAAGPVQQTTIEPDGTISSIGGGLPSRELVAPFEGVPLVMRSGSDITLTAAKVFSPSTGKAIVEGLSVSTVTSTPQRAANEALAPLVQWWTALSADQREARIREIEAAENMAQALKDVLVQGLKALAPLPIP